MPEQEIANLNGYDQFLNDSGCQRQLEEKLALALCKQKERRGPEQENFVHMCTSDDVRACFGGQFCSDFCHASCMSRKVVAGWCVLSLICLDEERLPMLFLQIS